MGQGREALRGVDAFGCLRSLRARSALDGVSWVQRGSVEIAVGQRGPATQSTPSSAPSLGRRSSWELVSASCLVARAYADANSVRSRSIACMIIARRRARAASDLAGPYLRLLGALSDKAGIAFVLAAQPFIDIIHSGFQAIAGGDALEVGRSAIFDPPKSGLYIIVRATRAEFPNAKFEISNDGRELLANGEPVERPYMILNFNVSTTRSDWFLIPELAEAYRGVGASVRAFDRSSLDDRLAAFRVVALTCPDLLPEHAQRLADQIEGEFRGILDSTARTMPRRDPSLETANSSVQVRSGPQPGESLELKPLEEFNPFR
jgi:hypothetical protein